MKARRVRRGQIRKLADKMAGKIKLLQVNVGRSRAATDLALATAQEKEADVLVLIEPNVRKVQGSPWLQDRRCDVAINLLNRNFCQPVCIREDGFVTLKFAEFTLVGCYISPNVSEEEYDRRVYEIMDCVITNPSKTLLMGDLNAKSATWSSPITDRRGHVWEGIFLAAGVSPLNHGVKPTFIRGRSRSYIDVTAATGDMIPQIANWEVLDEESLSYHQYIACEIRLGRAVHRNSSPRQYLVDWEGFEQEVETRLTWQINTDGERWKLFTEVIEASYRNALTPVGGKRTRPYWWTEDIEKLRREAVRARRNMQRALRRDAVEEIFQQLQTVYKAKKRALNNKINASKKAKWKGLLEDVNKDIWGLGYKIVAKFAGGSRPEKLPKDKEGRVLRDLFPRVGPANYPHVDLDEEPPSFTAEELAGAVSALRNKKAPGPDRIPSEAIKRFHKVQPTYMLDMFNELLRRQTFPSPWRTARVILLRKPGKDAERSDAYRPISLLSCTSKVYEHLISARLDAELEGKGILSENQYGFRKGRSTTDALTQVLKKALERTHTWLALVTLDVKNAFNSVRWEDIVEEMIRVGIPTYIINIIICYLSDRRIKSENNMIQVEAGVPQGSVVGPKLWNLSYNKVLTLPLVGLAWIVGFADDLGMLVAAESKEELEHRVNLNLRKVQLWLSDHSLQLAQDKTEAVILRGVKTKWKDVRFILGGFEVIPAAAIKYLGVHFGRGAFFGHHIREACMKADVKAQAVARLMPNMDGPNSAKRTVLAGVHASVLLYAAPIWADYMVIDHYRTLVNRSQRKVLLRVASAYRTVSVQALQVITGIVPLHLQAMERMEIYKGGGGQRSREEARENTFRLWQEEWESLQEVASWTRSLIRDVKSWVLCKHRRTNYFLTQALSGHGSFRKFLFKINRDVSDRCPYCGEVDSPEHTLFSCPRWAQRRFLAETGIAINITKDNVVQSMVGSPEHWASIEEMLTGIMKAKEIEERVRQAEERQVLSGG